MNDPEIGCAVKHTDGRGNPAPCPDAPQRALAPSTMPSIEDVVRLEGALHLLRFALDRAIRADFKPAPEYLRDLLDKVTDNPGEPCDRDKQYQRAEQAEDLLRVAHETSNRSEAERTLAVQRAEKAEERAEAASVVGTRHMARAEEAEAEVARLRAGEEPGRDPVAEPSPGQWIARWNASSADERLEVARRVIEDSARAARCFQMDHETRIVVADKMLAARLRVMNRSEATVARVRAESARIRSVTPTWGPVADIIDAALDDSARPREQRMRPTHPDGTPYSYCEITAEGWGFCDGCRMWSTGTPENPHQCPETDMQGPIDSKENGDV